MEQVNNRGNNRATTVGGTPWWRWLHPWRNCGIWQIQTRAGASLKRLWPVDRLMPKQVLWEKIAACGGPTLEQILPWRELSSWINLHGSKYPPVGTVAHGGPHTGAEETVRKKGQWKNNRTKQQKETAMHWPQPPAPSVTSLMELRVKMEKQEGEVSRVKLNLGVREKRCLLKWLNICHFYFPIPKSVIKRLNWNSWVESVLPTTVTGELFSCLCFDPQVFLFFLFSYHYHCKKEEGERVRKWLCGCLAAGEGHPTTH